MQTINVDPLNSVPGAGAPFGRVDSLQTKRGVLGAISLGLIVALAWSGLSWVIASALGSSFQIDDRTCVIIGAVLAVVGSVVFAWAAIVKIFGQAARLRPFRMKQFADSNGFEHLESGGQPGFESVLLQEGHGHTVSDQFVARGRLEAGILRLREQRKADSIKHVYTYLAVELDRTLPHLVLDSKKNNGIFSSFPVEFEASQRLDLEGDFPQHFTLYCPSEYERDALYVLTPDLMAALIDHASDFEVEFAGRYLVIFTNKQLDMAAPRTWEAFRAVVESVVPTVRNQTARYSDDRVAERPSSENSRAVSGQRDSAGDSARDSARDPGAVTDRGRRLKTSHTRLLLLFGAAGVLLLVGRLFFSEQIAAFF